MKYKILLYADFGIDDTLALIFSFFSKDIEIVGIVADYGNVSREKVLRNVNYLKYISGHHNIPLFEGATIPLTGISTKYYPEVHGVEGLGPIIPPTIHFPIQPIHKILEVITNNLEDLVIVSVGRLSSLSVCFILGIEVMQRVKEYLVMGGTFFYPGNVTAVAEANFYGDPYAANIILTYAKNLTIFPLNVTQRALITPRQVDEIDLFHQKTSDPLGLIIKPLLDYYYKFYSQSVPWIKGSPLHDAFPIWYLLNREQVTIREIPTKIIVDKGEAFGQSIADYRYMYSPEYVRQKVAIDFQPEMFQKEIMNTFLQVRTIPSNSGIVS